MRQVHADEVIQQQDANQSDENSDNRAFVPHPSRETILTLRRQLAADENRGEQIQESGLHRHQ